MLDPNDCHPLPIAQLQCRPAGAGCRASPRFSATAGVILGTSFPSFLPLPGVEEGYSNLDTRNFLSVIRQSPVTAGLYPKLVQGHITVNDGRDIPGGVGKSLTESREITTLEREEP